MCGSINIRKNGFTSKGKIRFRCVDCGKSSTRKRPDARTKKLATWFYFWIDGYTLKQLGKLSGYSKTYLRQIILRELAKDPMVSDDLSSYKYLVFDGKLLFGRKYSLLVIYDALTNKPIASTVATGHENRDGIIPWLTKLKTQGLQPNAVTTDGQRAGIYSFKEVWPDIVTQRCLFHIKLQITAWARIPPRTELGKALTLYVNQLFCVTNASKADDFYQGYLDILEQYKESIAKLDRRNTLDRDLLRAVSVIKHALPDLFHYLDDPNIAKTTSGLEGYFKQVQDVRGFRHNGLTEEHLFNFIKWKVFFDSGR